MTRPLMEWGVAKVTLGGQTTSGDSYLVKEFPGGLLIAALDGLGHGDDAAAAAQKATHILEAHTQESVIALLKRCHEALRDSRGAVMSLVSVNGLDESMTWAGVGNVEGLLLRARPGTRRQQESLLLRPGVLGIQLPAWQASILPLAEGDTIILATDGIQPDFGREVKVNQAPQQIATRILSQFAKGNDDALVLVARYVGQNP